MASSLPPWVGCQYWGSDVSEAYRLAAFAAFSLVLGLAGGPPLAAQAPAPDDPPGFVPGEILVKLKEAAPPLRFTSQRSRSAATQVRIEGEASNDAATLLAKSRNITARAVTASSVLWEPEPWSANQVRATPELSAIVQEIVGRAGWTNGNAMAFVISFGTGRRDAKSYNGDPALAPELHVEYTVVR